MREGGLKISIKVVGKEKNEGVEYIMIVEEIERNDEGKEEIGGIGVVKLGKGMILGVSKRVKKGR